MLSTLQTLQTVIPPGVIDLGAGEPQMDLLPLDLIRNAANHRLTGEEKEFLQYGAEQGDGYFRVALAGFLSRQYGFSVTHESLFTTAGTSSALALICALFTQPGDTIFVEEPTYFLVFHLFADHGLKLVPIQTDEKGLIVEDLIRALKETRPKFLYIVPTHQNPGGCSLSQERRDTLVELAREHNFLIVADEVYHLLSYTQPPPRSFGAFINSGHVLALGSFSKILAPGLRLGWLQTDPVIMQKIISCGVLDSGGGMNPFTSAIVRSLIDIGGLDDHLSRLQEILGNRIQTMSRLLQKYLPQAQFNTPHGGYFFWVKFPGMDTRDLRVRAKTKHIDLRPGVLFSSRGELADRCRLSVSYYDEAQIEEGILRLKHCLEK